jgi:hypothetical protein
MQQLAGNGFSQAEMIFFAELFHAADSRLPRVIALILPLGNQRDRRVDELVHRPHNSALNGVLNRLFLLGREFRASGTDGTISTCPKAVFLLP